MGGRFALENGIAVGGVATVYLGRDEVLGRPVAVKILHAGFDGSDLASRFEREGSVAAKLSHPNIVQVYDAGKETDDGRETSYIVMEYVSGGDLGAFMHERGPLPEGDLSRIGSDLAAGLAHAHERGVVHRDIKPQNVLMDEYGRPKLTDFGIAHALDETRTTKTGSYLGTTLYSSPEQLKGETVAAKSDVYSLGATLYEAAVGEPIFEGGVFRVASQQINEAPVPPTERGADITPEMESLILSCLSKKPDERPDAAELRDSLGRLSAEDGGASGPAPGGSRAKLAGMAVALLLLGATAMLGAASLLGLGDSGSQAGQEEREGQEAASAQGPTETPDSEGSDGEGSDGEGSGGSGALTGEAAAGTVAAMYLSVVREDYEGSYEFLSEGYRQREFPTRGDWEENFSDLRAITFTETPTARVSDDGGEAVVTAETATITNDGEAAGGVGTWDLVSEGGEWRIDGMDIRERSQAGDEV